MSGLTGARVVSPDGSFALGLRPGLAPVTDSMRVQLATPSFAPGDPHASRDGHPLAYSYVLTATRLSDGAPLTRFNPEAVLMWHVDPAALERAGVRGFPLHVYTYDEAHAAWAEVLSRWNPATQQIIASTPHFSLYSVGDGFDAVDNYVPTVNAFEVDLQSGAATTQYPIQLPPGPGGFAPKLSLSYNSGAVDRVDRTQQGPSTIGWGWSLTSNYVAATQHHFTDHPLLPFDPWTPSIVADGINGDLTAGTDGYWHTQQESYARVQYFAGSGQQQDDWWEAWDKDGAHYVFDLRAQVYDAAHSGFRDNRWMLHTATDTHGNLVTYAYQYEDTQNQLQLTPIAGNRTNAVYPYQITYGSTITETAAAAKIQVTFDVAPRAIGGAVDISNNDRDSGLYQSYRINKISVRRLQQGASFVPLRTYTLTQDYTTILTNTTTTDTYPHLTLTDITPRGNDDLTQLPATHLDYAQKANCCVQFPPEDWGHLWYVNNGYGGKVGFYYDAAGGDVTSWYRRVRARRIKDGLEPPILFDAPPHNVAYFYDYRGGAVNDKRHSLESGGAEPIHPPGKEFRGYSWVRVQDPMGQVTDHYFSQDDVFKAGAWRTQVGKAASFADPLEATPTATPNPDWTVTGPVSLTPDPQSPTGINKVWKLDQGGAVQRSGAVSDGADVSARVMAWSAAAGGPFNTTWKLLDAGGDYWGFQIYSQWNGKGYDYLPRAIWSVGGVGGTRDLSAGAPFTPRWLGSAPLNQWYRIQLHTSPDGRFALEVYGDIPSLGGKDYLLIKSGDPADSGTIPAFPAGQQWQFRQDVTTGNGVAALIDDYAETRAVYAQQDTIQANLPTTGPSAIDHAHWQVGANNCDSMTIRFVAPVEQWSSVFGTGSELGQTRRSRKAFAYDAFGNQREVDEYGSVDASGDERSTIAAFAVLSTTTSYLVNKVTQQSVYGGLPPGNVLLGRTRSYYDGQASGVVIRGDLTKQEQVGVLNGQETADRSAQQFQYDQYGNQTQITDADNHAPTITTYDAYYHAFPMQVTHPNGRSETMAYDFTLDAVSAVTDMNGTVTEHAYDPFARPLKTWIDGFGTATNPNESYHFGDLNQAGVSTPFYISYSRLLTGTQTSWQTRWFDGLGRPVQDVSPRGDGLSSIVVDTTYTSTGVISSTTRPYVAANANPTATVIPDPSRPKTIHYYDGAGRPSMVVNPDNSRVSYDYSVLQWVTTQDESGRLRAQHTDLLGRMDQSKETDNTGPSLPLITGYQYDMLDRLTTVTRDLGGANQTTSTLGYDALGRKNAMTDPDMGAWQYASDAAGNVIAQTDALAQTLLFSYDDMNRLTAKYYGQAHKDAGTPDVRYYYDNALGDAGAALSWGRLRNVEVPAQAQPSNANGHGYLYDPRGLTLADVVTTTGSISARSAYTVRYSYDLGGRLTMLTYPDPGTQPEQVSFRYNSQGMGLPDQALTSQPGDPPPVASAAYNERGQLTSLGQGSTAANNLLTTAYSYDDATTQRGWPTRVQVSSSSSTLLDLNMSYTANGDVSSVSQAASGPNSPVFTNTFAYDGFDRLTAATSSLFAAETYAFDSLSRMTSRTIGGALYPYSYADPAHKDAPTSYRGGAYGYDANGSQTSGAVGGAGQTRSFDFERRLRQVVAGSTTTTYIYDGAGKRVAQVVTRNAQQPAATVYIGALYEEQVNPTDLPHSAYTSYYFLGATLVGLRRANQSASGQYRLVGDHLGSTTLLVDTSGPPTVVQRQYYTPYGTSAYQYTAHGSLTSVDFTGQRLDDSDGLLYFGARYYDAALSYFISADVLIADSTHAQNLNRYSYASNNPLRYTDPTGRCVFQQDSSGQEQFTDPEKLDCTVNQFDHMSSNQRILWTQAFQLYYSLSHVFNGVVGAIMYFDASWQTGGINFTPGSSWMSLADAWTLAAMQDGMAMYQNSIGNNRVQPSNFVRGSLDIPRQWMNFYQRLTAAHGDFYAPGVANAWGRGEYAGVHYGIDRADQARGRPLGEEGYILDRAIEATDVFRLKLIGEGVPPQYRGGTFDPTSDPGWQVGAGLAVDFEARAEWGSGLLGATQWMYYTRIPLLRYGMH